MPLKHVSDEGGPVLVEIQKLQQCDTVRGCPLFPVLLRIWILAVPIRFLFDLSLIFKIFFLAINSASLWDPNFRLVLNFVLFLHHLGRSPRLSFISAHGPSHGPGVR